MKARLLSSALYLVASGLGVLAFIYPFFGRASGPSSSSGEQTRTPLTFTLLLVLCLLVLLYEVQRETTNTRLIALLGVLVAINAVLRFVEVAIPGPGGFSPVFFLILLTGYTYGGRFGFLMGALTMFVSALVTGGVGPWLPSQMFTAGWAGMSAPLVRFPVRSLRAEGKIGEVVLLAVFGAFWGLFYGFIINLWTWPFIAGPAESSWTPGSSVWNGLQSYGVYYLLTSLVWDLARAFGNAVFLLLFGQAALRVLRRFGKRFKFVYQLAPATISPEKAA